MPVTTEPLQSRPLGVADAAAGFRLSSEVGWNQTVADWRVMLGHGEAIGQFSAAGELVASALVLPYAGWVGWIAMVLTSASHRRLGLATANLRWTIERCDALGLIAGLDATPAGRAVYRPLGFADRFGLHRLEADRPADPGPGPAAGTIRPMTPADLQAVVALDGRIFGAERPQVLEHLLRDQPGRALVARRHGQLAGFVLARAGRRTLHLGPLGAPDPEVAINLVGHALDRASGPVSIDVPDAQDHFRTWLEAIGFSAQRPFTRMLRRADTNFGDPTQTFALVGPEFA